MRDHPVKSEQKYRFSDSYIRPFYIKFWKVQGVRNFKEAISLDQSKRCTEIIQQDANITCKELSKCQGSIWTIFNLTFLPGKQSCLWSTLKIAIITNSQNISEMQVLQGLQKGLMILFWKQQTDFKL